MTYRELIEFCWNNEGVFDCSHCEYHKECDHFIGLVGNVPSSYMVPSYCKKVAVELDLDKEIVNEEIIRCKDCTYYDADNFDGFCWFHNSMVKESDYCSKAKREDEEE